MELFKHRCPNEYKEFAAGNFLLLKTNKEFSRVPLDKLHEQNDNYIKSVSGATSSFIDRMTRHWLDGNFADQTLVRWELCRPDIG